jgi:hypothetical protein
MIIKILPEKIEYDKRVQKWCLSPYPKHPQGCPNYGCERYLNGIRHDLKPRVIRECPPTKSLIDMILDFSKPAYVIYNEFEVGKDAEERRLNCPKLKTPGEWYNLRYWQNRARAELYAEATKFLDKNPSSIVDLCPEAHGVNLVKSMQEIEIKLNFGEWPPEHSLDNAVYQIALGGYPKNYPEKK